MCRLASPGEAMSDGGSGAAQGRPFHCREWALGKLQHWLGTRCPGVLVMGGPGAGKTALCTEAIRPSSKAGFEAGLAPRCLASHFCRREDERTVEVWRFVLGLTMQLHGTPLLPPGYAQTLDSPSIALTLDPLHCQRDPDDTFRRSLPLCHFSSVQGFLLLHGKFRRAEWHVLITILKLTS